MKRSGRHRDHAPEASIRANGNIQNIGSNIGAFDSARISAGGTLTNEALVSVFTQVDIKKKSGLFGVNKKTELVETGLIREGTIQSAAGDLIIDAGGDIVSRGSSFGSGGITELNAGGSIVLEAVTRELTNVAKKSGFSGFSYGSSKTNWNDFLVSTSQVTGGDVRLFAGTDIIGNAANVSAYDTLELDAGGSITFDAERLNYYHRERGWSIGLSTPGSSLADTALRGGSLQDVARDYIGQNPFFASLYALSESETGAEVAFNAINSVTRGMDFLTGGPNGNQTILQQLNPLEGMGSSLTVSVSTWRNDRNWTESITSELVSGGNLYLRAGTDIALLGGTQVYADGDAVL